MPSPVTPPLRLLDPARRRTTVGLVAVVTLVAFEAMAVATVLPTATDELRGIRLYGLAFASFLIAELIGITRSGRVVDRHGPGKAFVGGLATFAVGLLIAGTASAMPMLVIGRAVQGYGAGAIGTTVYVLVRHAYDDALRPRIMAVMSSAWIVPAVLGPAVGGAVAEHLNWRLVFLAVAPCAVPVLLALAPVLRRVGAKEPTHPTEVVGRRAGTGRLLVEALRYRPGLPAAVAARAVLTSAFFGAEAFIPLGLTDLREVSATRAGLALTFGALGWAAGSWIQERLDGHVSRPVLVRAGTALVALGVLSVAVPMATDVPSMLAAVAWSVAGVGMGVAYSSISLIVLAAAPAGREGATTAALQLSDVLGILVGTGVGGALVATSTGTEVAASTLVAVCVLLATIAAGGALLAGRLPGGAADRTRVEVAPAGATVTP